MRVVSGVAVGDYYERTGWRPGQCEKDRGASELCELLTQFELFYDGKMDLASEQTIGRDLAEQGEISPRGTDCRPALQKRLSRLCTRICEFFPELDALKQREDIFKRLAYKDKCDVLVRNLADRDLRFFRAYLVSMRSNSNYFESGYHRLTRSKVTKPTASHATIRKRLGKLTFTDLVDGALDNVKSNYLASDVESLSKNEQEVIGELLSLLLRKYMPEVICLLLSKKPEGLKIERNSVTYDSIGYCLAAVLARRYNIGHKIN